MNKRQKILVYIISFIVVNIYSSTAQTSIGFGFGTNFPLISSNHFGSLVRVDSFSINLHPSKNEVDVSPYTYIELTQEIGLFLDSPVLLHVSLGYISNTWRDKINEPPFRGNWGNSIDETTIDWETKNSVHLINTQLGVIFHVTDIDMDVNVDFSLSSVVSSNVLFTYSLNNDPEHPAQFAITAEELAQKKIAYGFAPYFLDEEKTSIVLYNKEAPEINTFRFGFSLGLRKEFTVFDVPIIPSVSYQYLPQMISKYESASIHNLSIALGTKFLL